MSLVPAAMQLQTQLQFDPGTTRERYIGCQLVASAAWDNELSAQLSRSSLVVLSYWLEGCVWEGSVVMSAPRTGTGTHLVTLHGLCARRGGGKANMLLAMHVAASGKAGVGVAGEGACASWTLLLTRSAPPVCQGPAQCCDCCPLLATQGKCRIAPVLIAMHAVIACLLTWLHL